MAGHSKFANIKHKKAKNDAKRGKIFTKIGREIMVAVKQGGADPELNSRLKDVITKAKANNMPNDTIDRAIKRASGESSDVQYETIVYEGYGPGGVAVMVNCLTENKNRTAANVRHAFSKHGGNLGTNGCVAFMFQELGEIIVEKSEAIDEDDLFMLAIEAGANDLETDADGFTITTSRDAFVAVHEALIQAGIEPLAAEVTQVAETKALDLSEDDLKNLEKMLDVLEDDDDVQEVYHNLED